MSKGKYHFDCLGEIKEHKRVAYMYMVFVFKPDMDTMIAFDDGSLIPYLYNRISKHNFMRRSVASKLSIELKKMGYDTSVERYSFEQIEKIRVNVKKEEDVRVENAQMALDLLWD